MAGRRLARQALVIKELPERNGRHAAGSQLRDERREHRRALLEAGHVVEEPEAHGQVAGCESRQGERGARHDRRRIVR